jgi:membrane-bound lytic murein transglycosylase D
MNPELRGYYLGKGNISIMIPKGKAKGFRSNFSIHYKQWKKINKQSVKGFIQGDQLVIE